MKNKGIYNAFYEKLIGYAADQQSGYAASQSGYSAEALALRKLALDRFKAAGFPSTKHEDWKYTDLKPVFTPDYHFPVEASDDEPVKVPKFTAIKDLDACKMVLIDGIFNPTLSDPLPSGVSFVRLKGESLTMTSKFLDTTARESATPEMLNLNTAFFTADYGLKIAENAVLEKPLHLLHLYQNKVSNFICYRLLVQAGKYSKANLIETFQAKTEQPLCISYASEILLDSNAEFAIDHVSKLSGPLNLIQYRSVQQAKDSIFHQVNISLPGTDFIRHDTHIKLSGLRALANLWGFYLPADKQLIDHHTLVDHAVPHCNSNELYKGVLFNQARSVFNGKVNVQQDAQKTNAFQQNNNLLLSDQATCYSKPQLEIFADDVKCSHGSTLGQLDEEALFYLQSRGIGLSEAKKLLIMSFAYAITQKIQNAALQHDVSKEIEERLAKQANV